jgi:hypothetical protein
LSALMIFLFGGLSPEPLIDDGLTRAQRMSRARGKALRWGRLTVIERAGSDQSHGQDQSLALWRCVCDGGQIIVAGARQGLCEV